jgi:trans-aconitate 2-methyltransferase
MPYEFDGNKYAEASIHQREWGERIIAELDLQGTERVLDLGCGDGTLTARIADLIPDGEAVGIDASKGMIDAALPKGRKNLHFILLGIDDIDFIDQFDVVFSNAALHWVKDHRRLLFNVFNALHTPGKLRFNFAGDGNCKHFFEVVREAMALDSFNRYFCRFEWPWYMPTVTEYDGLVRDTKLGHVRVWGENADRLFPDEKAMIKWLDQPSLVPFLARLPQSERKTFRDFVVARMVEKTRQEGNTYLETFRRINVFAAK